MAQVSVSQPPTEIQRDNRVLGESADNGVANEDALRTVAGLFMMNFDATNELEKPDLNFLEEALKLPKELISAPAETDVDTMRDWIKNVLLAPALVEFRSPIDIKRRRPEVPVDIQTVSLPCSDGSGDHFDLRLYVPRDTSTERESCASKSMPAVAFLHGGGWIHGMPQCDDMFAIVMASELRAIVVGVDYRLAPENPYPKPLNDCCDALKWMATDAGNFNIDPDRLGLWGGSAGGNLAAASAIRLSQSLSSGPTVRLQALSLIVPAVACIKAQVQFQEKRTVPRSQNELAFAESANIPAAVVKEFDKLYRYYSGGLTDPCDPLLSPLLATPGSNHPKTHITVAACDFLRDQGLAYTSHLRSFGIDVVEDLLPGVPHGFTFPTRAKVVTGWLERQQYIF
ncbi:hypothetical protein H2204_003094 [Knufia peltigerae]|uniref:Alpha/beta hydrolase fold-3 domain-containing protein n=1 Tax=Knufia peltigerae TaxID=1002370 RepID=A0AA39D113_9EURO|nr:hypothetical protein H2204_003094 [Knufia peltigerae]